MGAVKQAFNGALLFGNFAINKKVEPWLMWLSGLTAGLQTIGFLVLFPVQAHAWVAGQVSSGGCMRGNRTLMFLSLSFSLLSPLSKNKYINKILKKIRWNRLSISESRPESFFMIIA